MVGGSFNRTHSEGLKKLHPSELWQVSIFSPSNTSRIVSQLPATFVWWEHFQSQKVQKNRFSVSISFDDFDGKVSRNQKSSPHFLANVGGFLFFVD